MFGNLGEMAKLMQKAKDIQKNMAKMKQDMAESEFEGSAPGTQVRAVVSGAVFPKKSFSMGHARDKRYYLECRKIV